MTLFGRPFQPRLWTSVAAFLVLLVLIGLGTWQVIRLEWKEGLIAERQERWTAPAIALPQDLSNTEEVLHRRVAITGHYRHDQELFLPGRSYRGTGGVGVVTPFVMDDGRTVMIYRGWVPATMQDTAFRTDSNPEGDLTVEGVIREGGWHGSDWAIPENNVEGNAWFYVNPAEMAAATNSVNAIEPIYLGLYREDPEESLPFTPPPPMDLTNNHLQYAITWYAFAVTLIVIFVIYHLGPKRKPEDEGPGETKT
ncbi:MAG: SURF1 family protein [Pseudomonadota bacterium]